MKINFITIFFTLILNTGLFAVSEDTLKVSDVIDYSLTDLLKIPVKVSSTKPVDLLDSPSSVTIIDHQLIERYGFQSVAEALSIVPGMDVLQTIIDQNVATSRGVLQNFYANKVLLMINNVPTWQPIYGDGHLERINIHEIERIEVLKGPASVLYGSNAYTGVINLILKNSNEKNSVHAHVSAGYPNIGKAGASVNYSYEDLNIYISGNSKSEERKPYELKNAKGYEYNGDSIFMLNEKYETKNFNFLLNYKAHSFLFNGFGFGHTHMGAQHSYSTGAGTIVNNNGLLFNYQYKKNVLKNFLFIGNLSYDYFKRSFPLAADRSNQILLGGSRLTGDLKMNYRFSKYLNLDFGALGEYRMSNGHDTYNGIRDTLIRNNLTKDEDIFEWSGYSQLNFSIWKVKAMGGIRYTQNKQFGHNISYRATALYKINRSNSLKLIAGSSFRVPTMFELYFDHYTAVGNRELKPETSTSYEIAYLLKKRGLFFEILAYRATYKNMIQRYSVSDTTPNQYRNAPQFYGYGVETEIKYIKPSVGQFFINYNYLSGKDTDKYKNYVYVPDHTISFGASKTIKKIYLSVNGKLISETMGRLKKINSQHTLDFKLGYFHHLNNARIHHSITIKNITGCNYLIPEYIRSNDINEIPTQAFGTRFVYTITMKLN